MKREHESERAGEKEERMSGRGDEKEKAVETPNEERFSMRMER